MNIVERIKNRLEYEKGNWPTIAENSGVGYQWISKFMQGRINNPGVNQLNKLSDYFRDNRKK